MGIPIELPSSPAPRSGPCHSAKPSWSSSAQHFPPSSSSSSSSSASASSTSLSSSSSSSYSNPFPVVPPALSLARQQLLQDTRPPLTSLAYHPPPPHSQSLPSQQRTLSSHFSSVYGSYHSFPSPSPPLRSNSPSVDQTTWIQQARADVAAASVSTSASTTATAVDETEIQSPSPARASRPHPNLRRISRVPVFMISPSGSGSGSGSGSAGTVNTLSVRPAPITSPATSTFNSDYFGTTMVRETTAPTAAISNMESSMMVHSLPLASQPRPIWHPSSPSLVHYSTRPLPPVPHPTSASSSTLHIVEPYPHHLQLHQQEQQEQPLLPQERAPWNYRFVNMNHADNHNRPETNTMSGSGMIHGYYYEDDRLRHDHSPITRSHHHQQHYQSADALSTGGTVAATTMTGTTGPAASSANGNVTVFSSSSTSLHAPRPRQYYPMRGGSEGIDSDDIDEEWILQQQQQQNQQQQHLSDRRFRHRPSLPNREQELYLQREQQHLHNQHLHHGQTTLSPLPLLSPSSPSSPSNSLSSISNSSSSSTLMTPIPSFLQGHPAVARTLIRADAFQQGVIHIYPENHAPILMYGRPSITPTPPPLHTRSSFSTSSSLTPHSSGAGAATLSSASSTNSNDHVATVVDQGCDNDLTVHIPARPLATPPSSAGSSSTVTILSTSPSVVLSPIPSLPPPAVTTTTSFSTLASQETIETTTPSSTSRLDGEGIITPLLARPPSAALSPVVTSGELYRFSSSPPSSARAYSGSPQTPSSMSLILLQPPQSVPLSAEGEEDAGKEGFDELSVSESHYHQHHRVDNGAPLLSGEQEQDRQQDQQPPVHPLEQFP